MQVPVVAYAATAVPATMDGGGVLYTDRTPARVAGVIDAVVSNADVGDAIIRGQDAALERLRAGDFDGLLLGFVERVAAAPGRERAAVTFDFWDQVRQADELDELRQFRPAAFRALPLAPDDARISTGGRDSDFAL
jgi:hypothetical protein